MSVIHSSFDQYCFSHKTITDSQGAAAVPDPEVRRECTMTYFPALPLLATNPGDATVSLQSACHFLANVCHRTSVCLVCNVSAPRHPTQGIEIFGNVSTPCGTLAIRQLCI